MSPRSKRSVPLEPDMDLGRLRRSRTVRRVGIAALSAVVLIGATGFLGVRTSEIEATTGPVTLTVEYAAVTRPGLATPFGIEVEQAGGFDGPVKVAVSGDYLSIFDENGLDPDPDKSTSDGTWLIWEFEPPDGELLAIDFDARLEPAVQWKREGAVKVLDGGPQVSFTTWVMP